MLNSQKKNKFIESQELFQSNSQEFGPSCNTDRE